MTPTTPLRIAALQICSTPDLLANHQKCCAAIAQLDAGQYDLITLPENMWYLRDPYSPITHAFNGDEDIFRDLARLAQQKQCAIHVGSFPEIAAGTDKVYNTSCIIHSGGTMGARYRKRHLFSLQTANENLSEHDYCIAGTDIVVDTVKGWRIGHSICYDLRFPEHYRSMAVQGMDLALVPSAFTRTTGPAHWEPLLRARAIENQCYVVAAGQCGVHCAGRASHGHSLAIDPWGTVIAQGGEEPTTLTITLRKDDIDEVRQQVPALRDHKLEG